VIFGEGASPRIRFRGLERSDLPLLQEWVNEPAVRRGISLYLPMSMAREELWFDEMLKRPPDEQPFAVDRKQGRSWQLLGTCGLFDIDWISRKAEIGIMIGDKRQWNKGYGTEAMRLILKHGFETLNMHRLYLRVFADNPNAIRTYEKAGFVLDGRLRQAHFADGVYKDDLLMSVLRPEWDAAQVAAAKRSAK
jgi:RimJ/RimL family protein N-acetyltransferase